jgi:hypothetical protein
VPIVRDPRIRLVRFLTDELLTGNDGTFVLRLFTSQSSIRPAYPTWVPDNPARRKHPGSRASRLFVPLTYNIFRRRHPLELLRGMQRPSDCTSPPPFTSHLSPPLHIHLIPSGRTNCDMPRGASPKREREYKEIEKKLEKEGRYPGREKEVAARIVNKQRAKAGETKKSSSTKKKSSKKKR